MTRWSILEQFLLFRRQTMRVYARKILKLSLQIRNSSMTMSQSYSICKNPLEHLNFVDGKRVAVGGESCPDIEPATGEELQWENWAASVDFYFSGKKLCDYQFATARDVDQTVAISKSAFKSWRKLTGFERGQILRKAADLIRVYSCVVFENDH